MLRDSVSADRQALIRQLAVPVVVMNPHYSGLGIARDLGPLGIRVIGVSATKNFPGNRSRFLEFRVAPDSLLEPEELLSFLETLSRDLGRRPVLFPTRDHDVAFILNNRERLEHHVRIPFADTTVIERVLRKDQLFEVARSAGLNLPHAVNVFTERDLEAAADLRFPVVCKPIVASQWRKPGVWEIVGRQKAVRHDSYDKLASFYRTIASVDPVVTVQEWIPGDEEALQVFGSWCDRNGEARAFFTARKRLQYPPLIGTGVVVEALRIPDLEGPSRALLKALRFQGISEIEFKRDARDGRLYLIELNPRHWDQHRLGGEVGVNLSLVAYLGMMGEVVDSFVQSDDSVYWIAGAELVRHALRCVRHGRFPRELRFLLARRKTYAVLSWRDVRPILPHVR